MTLDTWNPRFTLSGIFSRLVTLVSHVRNWTGSEPKYKVPDEEQVHNHIYLIGEGIFCCRRCQTHISTFDDIISEV